MYNIIISHYKNKSKSTSAFTIVELLIVIVVVAILAVIIIVAYNGVTRNAVEAAMQSDLKNTSDNLTQQIMKNGVYPDELGTFAITSGENTLTYDKRTATKFCLSVSSPKTVKSFFVTEEGTVTEGLCPIVDGSYIQTIAGTNCPTARTRVVDARDNHTYWVQKLADGKCWMLTNLAYAGDGTSTYLDTKALTNGTGGSETYTIPSYYVVPSTTNFTTEPTAPSTSTDGTGQYGYLYNWCGAMGGQATAACANASTPTPTESISVCPANWRLPTNNSGEFAALNTNINGGLTNTDSGLRTAWFGQRSGYWGAGAFGAGGTYGRYWTSTPNGGTGAYALRFGGSYVYPAEFFGKPFAAAVRCVAI